MEWSGVYIFNHDFVIAEPNKVKRAIPKVIDVEAII